MTTNINLQSLIVGILGISLISMIYLHYDTELILALITGLVGVLVPVKNTNTITTQEAIKQLEQDPTIQVQTEEMNNDKQEYS
ncbi:MAG: hypothetical protein BZ134_00210 [Methanosphaera sp. SHI1033]|nr:MAG: hypothetical protein BZ134_00210 [Methanosphaera sp. SHI1033]